MKCKKSGGTMKMAMASKMNPRAGGMMKQGMPTMAQFENPHCKGSDTMRSSQKSMIAAQVKKTSRL